MNHGARNPMERFNTGRSERGFTLVEMMVAILVIGILMLIGLPTFLGARSRAADRAAQADVRTGLAAAMTHFAEIGSFTGFDPVEARQAEPSLAWISPGPPARGEIDIEVASGSELLLVGLSSTNIYFCVAQQAGSPLTTLGKGQGFADVDAIADCVGGW
jgi:type IV pilus assembly protein PilA